MIAHCPATDLAWDCATGNGQVAVDLSKHFKKVIATDLSEKQIQNAIQTDHVDYRVLRAKESLDLDNQSLDLITVAQALHWFNLDKFYKEVKRLLKPGGVFATWAYSFHSPIQPEIDALLNDFYFKTLGPFWKSGNRLIWENYKDLAFPFSEIATPRIQLRVEWSLVDLMGYFRTGSATQLFIEKHRIDPTLELMEKLLPYWDEPAGVRSLTWDPVFRVGRPIPKA